MPVLAEKLMKVKNMKLEIDFSLSDLKNNWKPKIKIWLSWEY